MRRMLPAIFVAGMTYAVAPQAALAAPATEVPVGVQIGSGLIGLALAVVLLLTVLSLEKVAEGSAVGENITLVVAAAVCLAASMLVGWISHFLPDGFSTAQASLASDLLVVAAMALFALYFWRVRASLKKFLKGMQAYASALDTLEAVAVAEAQTDAADEAQSDAADETQANERDDARQEAADG